jgi:hypothetical protein
MQQEVKPILLSTEWSEAAFAVHNKDNTIMVERPTISFIHAGWEPKHLYIIDEKAYIKSGTKWVMFEDGVISELRLVLCNHKQRHDSECTFDSVLAYPQYYKSIVATTNPRMIADGIPSISDEFLKQFVVAQGKGKIMMEIHTRLRHLEDGLSEDVPLVYAPIKTDESGNAILTIVKDIAMDDPLLNIDGQLMHCIECNAPLKNGEGLLLGYCEKCCTGSGSVEESAKQVLQNNNLPTEGDFAEGFITGAIFGAEWQKEQSATDAVEFDDWKLRNSVRIRTKGHTDFGLMWIHDGAEYSSKQLYELWKKNS